MLTLEQAIKILELTLAEYSNIRSLYYSEIAATIITYLQGTGRVTTYRNRMIAAMREAFDRTAMMAWVDGGGTLPLSKAAADYLYNRRLAEEQFIKSLFDNLREMRTEEADTIGLYAEEEARKRAEGYCQTLDGLYSQIKVMAAGRKMITFVGVDGNDSCKTCKKLKNQRHQAAWWVRRGFIPYPGNINFECGCFRCQHVLIDDSGYIFTI